MFYHQRPCAALGCKTAASYVGKESQLVCNILMDSAGVCSRWYERNVIYGSLNTIPALPLTSPNWF